MASHQDEVARLERINYTALVPVVQVTPGMDLIIRDDVILTSSESFPAPDTTHACMLRAEPDTLDHLLDEVCAYFKTKGLSTTIYVSPACSPDTLPDRLIARGFAKHDDEEAWVVLDDLKDIEFRSERNDLDMHRIHTDEAPTFAETFLASFEMPVEFAPMLAEMLKPSIGLPNTSHYLATLDGTAVGTISLVKHEQYGIIGSTGILPEYRRSKVVVELFRAVYIEAQNQDINTLFAQTRVGSTAERLLLANNFRRSFVRQGYTLD